MAACLICLIAKWTNPNSYVERFNRTYRAEILNMYVFKTLGEVRELTKNWIQEYSEEQPHDSLGDLTPWEYRVKHEEQENSKLYV
jgi:putative transposase